MSFKTNTHLEGIYTVMDINGNVISEQKNRITDWGMTRLTGHNNKTPEYIMSLADNLRKIWIGEGTAPVNNHDFRLSQYIDGSFYTETNEPTITGTFYKLIEGGTPNEKLQIQFVKGSRFDFNSTTLSQINEVGISSNYEYPGGKYLTGTHEWVSTAAFPGGPNQKAGSGPHGTGWPYPHQNTLELSLFSRALLAAPVYVIKGDVLIIKYVLNVITNAHLVGNDEQFPFNIDTISDGVPMPSRKTNMRRRFFYELKSDNTVTGDYLEANYQGGRRMASASYGGQNTAKFYQPHFQFLPMLEVPAWGKNYIATYDDFNSSLYAYLGNGTQFPLTTATNENYLGERIGTYSSVEPWMTGGTTIVRVPNYLNTKERTSFKTLSAGHTVTCQHRFLYNPGEWFLAGDGSAIVKNFAFLRRNFSTAWTGYGSDQWDIQPFSNDRPNVGMFTALEQKYNPYEIESALYLGIDYTMTFTRSM